jgi:hypothetical protein
MMIIKKIKENKGFVLLFAMMISAIILAVALGGMNIAENEVAFSISGKDTNDAFFAADTGAECAMYFDRPTVNEAFGTLATPQTATSLVCAGNTVTIAAGPPTEKWTFNLNDIGNGGGSCAMITVDKTNSLNTTPPTIEISSIGVNESNCGSLSGNYFERELDVTYQQ